jgi:hypothetical protein
MGAAAHILATLWASSFQGVEVLMLLLMLQLKP